MKTLSVLFTLFLSMSSFSPANAQSFLSVLGKGAIGLVAKGALVKAKSKCQSLILDKKSELHLRSSKYRIGYTGGEFSDWEACNATCEISAASKRTLIINDSGKTTTFVVNTYYEQEDTKGHSVFVKCFLYGVPCTVKLYKNRGSNNLELYVPFGRDKTLCYCLESM